MKQDILKDLLGNLTLVNYIVAFIFVFLTIVIKWAWKTIDSVKNDKTTPNKFNLQYWVKDNLEPKLVSLFANIIAVFIVLRFSNEIIGQNFSYFLAVVVGFGLDYYVDKLKKMQHKIGADQ